MFSLQRKQQNTVDYAGQHRKTLAADERRNAIGARVSAAARQRVEINQEQTNGGSEQDRDPNRKKFAKVFPQQAFPNGPRRRTLNLRC